MDTIIWTSEVSNDDLKSLSFTATQGTHSTEENEFIRVLPALLFNNKLKIVSKNEPHYPLGIMPYQRYVESQGVSLNGALYGKGRFVFDAQDVDIKEIVRTIANFRRLSYERKLKLHRIHAFGEKLKITLKN